MFRSSDWIDLVKTVKKTNPFQVRQMKRDEFLWIQNQEHNIFNRS